MLDILDSIGRNWWMLLLRGIVAILFGLFAFAMPGVTVVSLALLYGVYAFVDGVTEIGYGFASRTWWMVFAGVLGLFVGIYAIFYPAMTAYILLMLIAAWAVARGVLDIIAAIWLRKQIANEWMLILGGVLSILVGFALFASPAAGALAMIWLIGAYAIVFGLVMVVMAFRVHVFAGRISGTAH